MPATPQPWPDVAAPPLLDGAVPLAATWRGGEVESLHLGHAVLVNTSGELVVALGRPEAQVYPRSALKPIQALPLWLAGLPERFGLGPPAQAIALASHGGAPEHLVQVQAWLGAAQQGEEALVCAPQRPIWPAAAQALDALGQAPTRLHHNCSGQHAMMLALAQAQGWPTEGYHRPEHPVQAWSQRLIEELGGLPQGSLGQAPDGCGLPAWRMPIQALALAFARLGRPQGLGAQLEAPLVGACQGAVAAMLAHPELVADPERFDAQLMKRPPAYPWATKAGSEGVHAGCIPHLGLGWAIKVLDGSKAAVPAALSALLRAAGLLPLMAHPSLP